MSLDSHPLAAFFPQNVAKNPQNFVGPCIAGAIVQAIEVGILINQSAWFWPRADRETIWVKTTVILASIFACIQTGLSFHATWRLMVYNFGDWGAVVNLHWSDKVQPLLNALVAAPVQAFLIWRCWNASNRRWFVVFGLVTLLIACIISATLITVDIFKLDTVQLLITPPTHLPYTYIIAFVLTVALDITITGIMLNFLVVAKSSIISRRADFVINRLMRSVWEAAVPPCVCAIIAMSIYVTMSRQNFWDLFMQNILGKLYLISLFVVLNWRHELRELHSHPTHVSEATTPALPTFRAGNNGDTHSKQIRVHIQTVIDTDVTRARQGDTAGDSYELTQKRRVSVDDSDREPSPPLGRQVSWKSKLGTDSTTSGTHADVERAVVLNPPQIQPAPRTWTENGRFRRESDLRRERTRERDHRSRSTSIRSPESVLYPPSISSR